MTENKNKNVFMHLPLPSASGGYTIVRHMFSGLDYRHISDSGKMSYERGVATTEAPCLVPARKWEKTIEYTTDESGNGLCPCSVHIFGDNMVVVYSNQGEGKGLFADIIKLERGNVPSEYGGRGNIPRGLIDADKKLDTGARELVVFNQFTDTENIWRGKFAKKLLVFPDRKLMPLEVKLAESNATAADAEEDETKWYTFEQFAGRAGADETCIYRFTQYYNHRTDGYTHITYWYYNDVLKEWTLTGTEGVSHSDDEFGHFDLFNMGVEVTQYSSAAAEEYIYVPTGDSVGDSSKRYYRKKDSEPENEPESGSGQEQSGDTGDGYEEVTVEDYGDTDGLYERALWPTEKMLEYNGISEPPDRRKYYFDEAQNLFYRYHTERNGLGNRVGWQGETSAPVFPGIEHATVHLSRLFGAGDGRVYASGYNNYADWAYDMDDDYNESAPWCSVTGANTKAGGEFTAITTYQNHVIAFKKDFMHELYNTKNPFTVHDVYACGCVDARTVQEVGGKLIFASTEGIMIYTGSKPRLISYELNIDVFDHACCSGSDGRFYYLFYIDKSTENHLFVYDTWTECWSEEICENIILGFAYSPEHGLYRLEQTDADGHGAVYKQVNTYGEWSCETDNISAVHGSGNAISDIKHIQRLNIVAELAQGSEMRAYILYDGEEYDADTAETVCDMAERVGRINIRILPRMSVHSSFRIRLEGRGYVRIYGMEIQMKRGGTPVKTYQTEKQKL